MRSRKEGKPGKETPAPSNPAAHTGTLPHTQTTKHSAFDFPAPGTHSSLIKHLPTSSNTDNDNPSPDFAVPRAVIAPSPTKPTEPHIDHHTPPPRPVGTLHYGALGPARPGPTLWSSFGPLSWVCAAVWPLLTATSSSGTVQIPSSGRRATPCTCSSMTT